MPRLVPTLTAAEAAARIPDGATIALSGSGGGVLEPDELIKALAERFAKEGHPRDLTVMHALGIGDGEGSGLARLAREGMLACLIGGHWSWSPELQGMAAAEEFAAYTLPAGAIMHLYREIGAGRPGLVTPIGLGTFADPANGGGRVNAKAKADIVEKIKLDGKDYLRYLPRPIDVSLLRATWADPHGNLSCEREAADIDNYVCALAARNSGGMAFAQVAERRDAPVRPARLARVPGVLLEGVVIAPGQKQTCEHDYDPAVSGEAPPPDAPPSLEVPAGVRGLIARRAARELAPGMSVNFGFGMPDGVPAAAAELGIDLGWTSVEQGWHNAEMLGGRVFGAGRHAQAQVSSPDQFDYYSGGGPDIAFLGMGEMDAAGNVNVSWLGKHVVGPGGFVEITQRARKVVFCGTFEAKGFRAGAGPDGRLAIEAYGEVPKVVEKVRHITFSGERARRDGQQVVYVTERAVFSLQPDGVRLEEVAPGADPRRDVLDRMGFAPALAPGLGL
ncbi:MAG: acyl CoA:acetate/3-ketoacid CoA transferase [Betaproteobacteria bacterium AqS2]|uniref:Acetate CoA-transferase YdiF n=1 Tax=Candidatus Amphirhobacter heronislandensis TaxID=1732024 RepID=A0A930UBG1_9GAMM|nr:acyl CoA:acetate/3-ketoacid CoA transferase [Betaproteobacteria bacterium AqS2]